MKKYRIQLLYFLAIMAMLLGACSENEEVREKEIFTVSFVVNGQVVEKQKITYDELVKRVEDPVSEETFVGWFIKVDDYMTQYNFKSPVRKNLTLYAEWESSGYTVTYMLNKEEMDDIIVRVPKGAEAPLLQLKTEEEELKAWCIDAELEHEYDLSLVNAPLVLYAKWESLIVEPEEPVMLIAECESGEFGNGATLDGGNGSASGGNAVNIAGGGYVKVRFDIPKVGSYQVAVTYLTWAQGAIRPSKINKIEIPGVLAQTEVDFVGTDKFETINIGVYAFTKGTVEVILSASWGWTYFDKVTLVEVEKPISVTVECETGQLGNGAKLEIPKPGASGENAVNIGQSGNVRLKVDIPKEATYKVTVRYFTWGADKKMNKVAISDVLAEKEYNFVGTNEYENLEIADVTLPVGEIEIVLSASWGWTYFDKIVLEEIVL
mgnify:CR=1 FL=1